MTAKPGSDRSLQHIVLRYAAAVGAIGLMWLMQMALQPYLMNEMPFILTLPAVVFAAWYGGYGAALLAALLGAFEGYWVLAQDNTSMPFPSGRIAAVSVYLCSAFLVIFLTESQRRSTARMRWEAEARIQSESGLAVTLRSIGDAVIALDTSNTVTFMNQEAERLTGWKVDQAAGKSRSVVFCARDEITQEPAPATLDDKHSKPRCLVLISKGGGETHIEESASPITDPDGRHLGSVLVFRDITARREAEEAVKQQNDFVSAVLDTASAVVVVLDREGHFVQMNEFAERLCGYTLSELKGRPFYDVLLPPGEADAVRHNIADLFNGMEQSSFESVWVTKGGAKRLIAWSNAGLRQSHGDVEYVVSTGIDLTDRKEAEQEISRLNASLQARVDELEAVLNVLPIGLAIAQDAQCERVRANAVLNRALDLGPDPTLRIKPGEPLPFNVVRNGRQLTRAEMPMTISAAQGIELPNVELELVRRDGRTFRYMTSTTPLLDAAGKPSGCVSAFLDITERKEIEAQMRSWNEELERRVLERTSELKTAISFRDELLSRERRVREQLREMHEALHESEANYRLLFAASPHPVAVIDADTFGIIAVNEAATAKYGYSTDEFLKLNVDALRAQSLSIPMSEVLANAGAGDDFEVISRHRKSDGSIMDVEVSGRSIRFAGRPAWLVISNDITERVRASEDLRSSFEEVRQLAQHLQSVREEERTLVAREVHDELGQSLTGIKFDIAWVLNKIDQMPHSPSLNPLLERLDAASNHVDTTIQAVRRIATQLRPAVLDALGLVAAIEWQTRDFAHRTQIACPLITEFENISLPDDCATALFRILQEALTNVIRHAHATEVRVSLLKCGDELALEVVDNGSGMAEDSINASKSLGLLGMRERALAVGGEVALSSEPGQGTRVRVVVPLISEHLTTREMPTMDQEATL